MASSGTILVVEDDLRMQKVLTRIFTQDGFEVHAANNGVVALTLFE